MLTRANIIPPTGHRLAKPIEAKRSRPQVESCTRQVLQEDRRRKKATPAEIATAGPVIDIYKLGEFLEELDMLESPMRTRKYPKSCLTCSTAKVRTN